MIKYVSYAITFAEIPNEVSLTIQLSNCPFRCDGCHSPELQQDIGEDLERDLPLLLEQYADRITCVCFMGDGPKGQYWQLRKIAELAHDKGLKTAQYSGYKDWDEHDENIRWFEDKYLDFDEYINSSEGCSTEISEFLQWIGDTDFSNKYDYVKIGDYRKELGGLNSPTTNQKMYRLNKKTEEYEDITSMFWNKKNSVME